MTTQRINTNKNEKKNKTTENEFKKERFVTIIFATILRIQQYML